MDNIEGRNAVVTGALEGIGPAVASALAREGVNLLLIGTSQAALKELAAELRENNVEIEATVADMTDEQERRNIPKRARSAFGQIDILVNNSAIGETGSFAHQEEQSIAGMIETNITAPVLITREILPPMLQRNMGHVVNITSLAGRLGLPHGAVYAGTAAALIEWSLSLNAEIHESAVNVSVFCADMISAAAGDQSDGSAHDTTTGAAPERAAQSVIRAIKKNCPEILSNAPARPRLILRAVSPAAADWLNRTVGPTGYLRAPAT